MKSYNARSLQLHSLTKSKSIILTKVSITTKITYDGPRKCLLTLPQPRVSTGKKILKITKFFTPLSSGSWPIQFVDVVPVGILVKNNIL